MEDGGEHCHAADGFETGGGDIGKACELRVGYGVVEGDVREDFEVDEPAEGEEGLILSERY